VVAEFTSPTAFSDMSGSHGGRHCQLLCRELQQASFSVHVAMPSCVMRSTHCSLFVRGCSGIIESTMGIIGSTIDNNPKGLEAGIFSEVIALLRA